MKEWLKRIFPQKKSEEKSSETTRPVIHTLNISSDSDTQSVSRSLDETVPTHSTYDALDETLPPFEVFQDEFEMMYKHLIVVVFDLLAERGLQTDARFSTQRLNLLFTEVLAQSGLQETDDLFGVRLLNEMPSLSKEIRTAAKSRLGSSFHNQAYLEQILDSAMRRHYQEWLKRQK